MENLQLIVDKLNADPFNKNIRIIDLDELSPLALLGLLNDVFVALDPHMQADMQAESDEERAVRMLSFLHVLKCPLLAQSNNNNPEAFKDALLRGQKETVHALLHWALSRFQPLKKRAYLAQYLLPIDVPAEFLQDDRVSELQGTLRQLQDDFKTTHKALETLRSQRTRSEELKREMSTLEEEKRQLEEKIEALRKLTGAGGSSGMGGADGGAADQQDGDAAAFQEMLAVTSALRGAQEEEARCHERIRDQRIALQQAQLAHDEVRRRLHALQESQRGHASAESLLEELNREVSQMETNLRSGPQKIALARRRLETLEAQRREPKITRDNLEMLQKEVASAASEVADMRTGLRSAVSNLPGVQSNTMLTGMDAITRVWRQQIGLEEQVEDLRSQLHKLKEEEEALHSSQLSQADEGKMTKAEFEAFKAQLTKKVETHKRMKKELASLRFETTVLHRTEQILKERNENVEQVMSALEARKGVAGFRKTQEDLERASEATAKIDAQKGQTLEEISAIVRDINNQLKERKAQLRPMLAELREQRRQAMEVEQEYNQKREVYEKEAISREMERQQLEREADAFQQECIREESRYHLLNSRISILEAQSQKVRREEAWQRGDGRLLPEFKSLEELYTVKNNQQKSRYDTLKAQRKDIQENESTNMAQRTMFANLQVLLEAKRRESAAAAGGAGQGGIGHSAAFGVNVGSGGGGMTNVMTIEQGS